VFVATTGSDDNSGTIDSPLATVKQALSVVPKNGTIVIRGGSYHQSGIFISNVGVTIQSYPGEAVWFDGSTGISD
jgi:trimeric autotransporter adhesin